MTRLIAIVGATGTGKSALSLGLAEAMAARGRAAEIVNADAMQLYRGMDIGTAKLPAAERRGIPHHMLDVLSVTEEASVADYQLAATVIVDDVQARGAVPILVGGSGLYVSSVLFAFEFPGTDDGVRARLEAELEASGPADMHTRLRAVDADAAAAIGPHNGRRLVRALEVNEITGMPFRVGLPDERDLARPTSIVHVTAQRDELTPRLDERVTGMWASGMLDEVRALRDAGLESGTTARQAIGYAQALAQLRGEIDEATAVDLAQSLTRRYARRQVSWFKRYPARQTTAGDDAASLADALLADDGGPTAG